MKIWVRRLGKKTFKQKKNLYYLKRNNRLAQIPPFTTTTNDKYDKGSESTFAHGTLDWLPQRPDLNITEAV